MNFQILTRNAPWPAPAPNKVFLRIDHWNDYSYVTMFDMFIFDANGQRQEIGSIKIAFKGQTVEVPTFLKLPPTFDQLGDEFFSVGQGTEYYRNVANLPNSTGTLILQALRDIALNQDIIPTITEESVFSISLLRSTSLSVIKGQYSRLLAGKPELTDFKFRFTRPNSDRFGSINLEFSVIANSIPSTNIHAVIGRNGVGKTTLLNGMIEAVTDQANVSKFIDLEDWQERALSADYFSSLVSISFSAFDPFTPPQDQPDPAKGTCYFYVGLKDPTNWERFRNIPELRSDCAKALITCFLSPKKTQRWLSAIEKLGSDENFGSMKLEQLFDVYQWLRSQSNTFEQSDSANFRKNYLTHIENFLSRMSSGHAIVLLTITRLVATVEEKTLVLMDEPESHLHPPLLSAFIRALSDLLHDQNGVAIIATHSPVVLQEIPKTCVWKIYRVGTSVTPSRPTNETFGENVGVLTSEVFSLEVERSGFHYLLSKTVQNGGSYEEILSHYGSQLGFEARALLKSLIANRDRGNNGNAT